jgi:predicted nucleotidyltransferase
MRTTMVEFQLAHDPRARRPSSELVSLCRKYRVRRLDVFGLAARSDFDADSSDVDLLVEFDDMAHPDRPTPTWGF